MSAAFIGLDLAKSVFQVHGVDAQGKVVVTKRLRRDAVLAFFANLPVCVVGMEACAGSHFWAREIARLGHTVRLMAPQYVKPYVKRQKNDRADAEAICEAVQRPSMRFVAVKSEEQQSTLAIHRVRETLVAQKTQLINALRAHLAEFGIIAPQGAGKVSQLTAVVADLEDSRVPARSFGHCFSCAARILAAFRQKLHLSRCSDFPSHLTQRVDQLRLLSNQRLAHPVGRQGALPGCSAVPRS